MAHTKVTKTGTQNNGTANTFSYSGSFDVFKASEVEVELDNVALTFTTSTINESASPREYTVDYDNKTVHVGGANLASTNSVVIQPVTDMGTPTPRATYEPGASVTSADLNNNQLQLMRKAMEYNEQKLSSRGGTMTGNLHLGKDVDISFEGDTDNAHEITLTAADPTSDKTITFPDTTGTVVTTGDTGTVATGMIANDAINADKIANDVINSEHYAAGSIDLEHMSANSVDSDQYVNGSIDNEHYADGSITSDKLSDATVITSSEQASASSNDTSFLTSAAADARFFNVSTTDTIKDGQTFPDNDTSIATTAAINDRIVDLVDDVGGFVPIANELSFPNANPDVNNGTGTLVSIKALSQNLTSNGSGVVSIGNGTVGGNTVVINGLANSTTYNATFGMIVETTSTLHTYTFHRLVPKATEVTTVAGNISNVNTVAGISGNVTTVAGVASSVPTVAGIASNVTTVAGISSNVTTVAGVSGNVTTVAGISSNVTTVAGNNANVTKVANIDSNVTSVANIDSNVTTVAGIASDVTSVANDATDIGAVAGKATEIGRLGTADAVADMALLGTADAVADMNTLATSANVTAMENCSDDIANINTVSGSISNVNTVGTNITAVTNASTYLNNFLSLYLGELASDPVVDALGNSINEGDLYWNTSTKLLRVYNGSVWQGVNDNSVDLLKIATGGFEIVYTASAGSNNIDLGALAISGAHFSNESLPTNKMSLAKGSATYNLGGI